MQELPYYKLDTMELRRYFSHDTIFYHSPNGISIKDKKLPIHVAFIGIGKSRSHRFQYIER